MVGMKSAKIYFPQSLQKSAITIAAPCAWISALVRNLPSSQIKVGPPTEARKSGLTLAIRSGLSEIQTSEGRPRLKICTVALTSRRLCGKNGNSLQSGI